MIETIIKHFIGVFWSRTLQQTDIADIDCTQYDTTASSKQFTQGIVTDPRASCHGLIVEKRIEVLVLRRALMMQVPVVEWWHVFCVCATVARSRGPER